MSKFYGTVIGYSATPATRRGHREIKTCAQSWNGSVITQLRYDHNDLMVDVSVDTGSSTFGHRIFSGTFDEFVRKLQNNNG